MFLEFLFFSSCTVDKFYGQPASRRARIAELLDRIDDGEEPDNINYIEPPAMLQKYSLMKNLGMKNQEI